MTKKTQIQHENERFENLNSQLKLTIC